MLSYLYTHWPCYANFQSLYYSCRQELILLTVCKCMCMPRMLIIITCNLFYLINIIRECLAWDFESRSHSCRLYITLVDSLETYHQLASRYPSRKTIWYSFNTVTYFIQLTEYLFVTDERKENRKQMQFAKNMVRCKFLLR